MPPITDEVRDRRIARIRPLVSPALLREDLPLLDAAARVVVDGRDATSAILTGADDRLLVVVGPCSVHDPRAALDYAARLAEISRTVRDQLLVVMRVYFEKPRTTLGWKGLINDPLLDGSFDVNRGLRTARALLLDVLALGLPVGCEFLDPISPQYLADTVSWGSIGARTAQSQVHRQLSSGLSMPIGIKNSTEGDVQAAVDACGAAAASLWNYGANSRFTTTGNPDCHVILRGGRQATNFDTASVEGTLELLERAGLPTRVVVDASHGNSGKDHHRQPLVVADLAQRLAAGERGVVGVMLESFLVEGAQKLLLGQSGDLVYGQSVTDSCMSWESTETVLGTLAEAVAARVPARAS